MTFEGFNRRSASAPEASSPEVPEAAEPALDAEDVIDDSQLVARVAQGDGQEMKALEAQMARSDAPRR